MPSATYYREQARVLLEWANNGAEPGTARRLTNRAQEMLALAQKAEAESRGTLNALDHFNTQWMMDKIARLRRRPTRLCRPWAVLAAAAAVAARPPAVGPGPPPGKICFACSVSMSANTIFPASRKSAAAASMRFAR